MPMGPFELLDHVGIDVAANVAGTLFPTAVGQDDCSKHLTHLVEKNWLGKKSGIGFYRYGKRGGKSPNRWLPPGPKRALGDLHFLRDGMTLTQRRLIYPLLNEAVRALDESVVSEPWMVDLGMVLGTGFAPMHGGPLRLIDALGPSIVLHNLKSLAESLGQRFEPARGLIQTVRQQLRFVPDPRPLTSEESHHESRYASQP